MRPLRAGLAILVLWRALLSLLLRHGLPLL